MIKLDREVHRITKNAIDGDLAQFKSVFTSVQQQSPDNSYVDLAVFRPRDVEEEVREIAVALVNVRPLGEDLPERCDTFFRCALVRPAQLPIEIVDHPDVFPKLRRIRRILSRRIFQSRSFIPRVNKIAPGYVETGVGNVQCETIEGRFAESDNGTDTSPSRGRGGSLITLTGRRRMQRARRCVAVRTKGGRAVHDLDMTLSMNDQDFWETESSPWNSELCTKMLYENFFLAILILSC